MAKMVEIPALVPVVTEWLGNVVLKPDELRLMKVYLN
jgi:hypothetical protein